MGTRLDRLRAELTDRGIDAMLVSCTVNQSWCCGFDFEDGYLLVCEKRAYLITDPRYIEAAVAEADSAFECVCATPDLGEMLRGILSDNGAETVGIEDMELSYYDAMRFKDALYPHEILPTGSMLDDLRAKKDSDEIEKIIEAQRITDAAFAHILGYIREGVSECDIALELEFFMRRMGATARSFDIICASGSASSRPHAVPRSTPIERGLLTMDFGCIYGGYCSDMTRTVCVGKATDDERRLYDTVLEAQCAALAYITDGVRCTEVDRVAREITEREYAGGFSHGLGHGVGRRIHESPRLSPRAGDKRLSLGHVVTVEPGIYLEGRYGCRIEDMVIIGDGCARNITASPKELIEI